MSFKNIIEDIVDPAVGPVLEMVGGICLEGAAGIIVPGVGNMILAYKQQRLEKNVEDFIAQVVQRQDELNKRLEGLDTEKIELIQKHYFGLVTDYVLDVRQKAKIDYIVNGFINIAGMKDPQEDVVLLFYDTLDQLNLLDIRVLKLYFYPRISDDDYYKVCDEFSLDYSQYGMIQEKLSRLGLLESKNEQKMDDNLKNIAIYLENADKGKKNNKLKINRISNSDSYNMTKFGRGFIDFFISVKMFE